MISVLSLCLAAELPTKVPHPVPSDEVQLEEPLQERRRATIFSHPQVEATWSGEINDWDGGFNFITDDVLRTRNLDGTNPLSIAPPDTRHPGVWHTPTDSFVCGMKSHHDNTSQDRKFQIQSCKFHGGLPSAGWLPRETIVKPCAWLDQAGSCECDLGTAMVGFWSFHNDRSNDRFIAAYCAKMPGGIFVSPNCEADRNWQNGWDRPVETSRIGWAMTGIYSEHANHQEDRRWMYKYCQIMIETDDGIDESKCARMEVTMDTMTLANLDTPVSVRGSTKPVTNCQSPNPFQARLKTMASTQHQTQRHIELQDNWTNTFARGVTHEVSVTVGASAGLSIGGHEGALGAHAEASIEIENKLQSAFTWTDTNGGSETSKTVEQVTTSSGIQDEIWIDIPGYSAKVVTAIMSKWRAHVQWEGWAKCFDEDGVELEEERVAGTWWGDMITNHENHIEITDQACPLPVCNDLWANSHDCGVWKSMTPSKCTSGSWVGWMMANCKSTCEECEDLVGSGPPPLPTGPQGRRREAAPEEEEAAPALPKQIWGPPPMPQE